VNACLGRRRYSEYRGLGGKRPEAQAITRLGAPQRAERTRQELGRKCLLSMCMMDGIKDQETPCRRNYIEQIKIKSSRIDVMPLMKAYSTKTFHRNILFSIATSEASSRKFCMLRKSPVSS